MNEQQKNLYDSIEQYFSSFRSEDSIYFYKINIFDSNNNIINSGIFTCDKSFAYIRLNKDFKMFFLNLIKERLDPDEIEYIQNHDFFDDMKLLSLLRNNDLNDLLSSFVHQKPDVDVFNISSIKTDLFDLKEEFKFSLFKFENEAFKEQFRLQSIEKYSKETEEFIQHIIKKSAEVFNVDLFIAEALVESEIEKVKEKHGSYYNYCVKELYFSRHKPIQLFLIIKEYAENKQKEISQQLITE